MRNGSPNPGRAGWPTRGHNIEGDFRGLPASNDLRVQTSGDEPTTTSRENPSGRTRLVPDGGNVEHSPPSEI
jgi:hypothetical protein